MIKTEPVILDPEDNEPQLGDFIKSREFEGPLPEERGVEHVLLADHDLLCLRKQLKPEFTDSFQKARESFVEGDWINAQTGV